MVPYSVWLDQDAAAGTDAAAGLSIVLQVCVIVDEEGTEAAAVTSVVMMRCMAVMAEPPKLVFNR